MSYLEKAKRVITSSAAVRNRPGCPGCQELEARGVAVLRCPGCGYRAHQPGHRPTASEAFRRAVPFAPVKRREDSAAQFRLVAAEVGHA